MRTPFKKPFFSTPEDFLPQLLVMRLAGHSILYIAQFYQMDRTSIRNWFYKFSIEPKTAIVPAPSPLPKTYKYQYLFDEEERVNPGKSYQEYLIQDRKNKLRRNYPNIYELQNRRQRHNH